MSFLFFINRNRDKAKFLSQNTVFLYCCVCCVIFENICFSEGEEKYWCYENVLILKYIYSRDLEIFFKF